MRVQFYNCEYQQTNRTRTAVKEKTEKKKIKMNDKCIGIDFSNKFLLLTLTSMCHIATKENN